MRAAHNCMRAADDDCNVKLYLVVTFVLLPVGHAVATDASLLMRAALVMPIVIENKLTDSIRLYG
jgi:hypothetical protein